MLDNNIKQRASLEDKIAWLLANTEYRYIRHWVDKEEVYRLRYRFYLDSGLIKSNPTLIYTDSFDDLPNSYLFGIYLNRQLATTIRLHITSNSCQISPGNELFADILGEKLNAGKIIIEPNRFAFEPHLWRKYPELTFITLRIPLIAATFFKSDLVAAAVPKSVQAYYKRVLMCEPISEPRTPATFKEQLNLIATELPLNSAKILENYPFLAVNPKELEFFTKAFSEKPQNFK